MNSVSTNIQLATERALNLLTEAKQPYNKLSVTSIDSEADGTSYSVSVFFDNSVDEMGKLVTNNFDDLEVIHYSLADVYDETYPDEDNDLTETLKVFSHSHLYFSIRGFNTNIIEEGK